MIDSFAVLVGSLLERAGRKLRSLGTRSASPFDVFLEPNAIRLNRARLKHLSSLHLDITGKRVLEVGAGIGLLTGFFEELGCRVLSTDGREENVAEITRRFPNRLARKLDLDSETDLSDFGQFDIIFCYGTLYHLSRPEQALKALAAICTEMILLETCVTPGKHSDVHLVRETASLNQSVRQIGCRPTRPWIMEKLAQYWGYACVSKRQPQHEEFEVDWELPFKSGNHRAVFVGAKSLLINKNLLDYLPDKQVRMGDENSN